MCMLTRSGPLALSCVEGSDTWSLDVSRGEKRSWREPTSATTGPPNNALAQKAWFQTGSSSPARRRLVI